MLLALMPASTDASIPFAKWGVYARLSNSAHCVAWRLHSPQQACSVLLRTHAQAGVYYSDAGVRALRMCDTYKPKRSTALQFVRQAIAAHHDSQNCCTSHLPTKHSLLASAVRTADNHIA